MHFTKLYTVEEKLAIFADQLPHGKSFNELSTNALSSLVTIF